MSALIKSGAASAVRSFAPAAPEPARAADPRDAQMAALRSEVARLKAQAKEAEAAAKRAVAEATEQGRLAGLAEAADGEEDRLDALQAGLGDAARAFAARLDLLDGLAPQLARAALAKLFTSPDGWAERVEAMLARQLGALRRSSIVALYVSPLDFADAGAVRGLSGDLRAELDADLAAGACRIEMKLGQLDLDLREQWATLAALLDDMARGEAA